MLTTTKDLEAYLDANRDKRLASYEAFLRIPSISALPAHAPDCRRAAEFIAGELRGMGVEHVDVSPTAGHPVVYGDWLHAAGAPTVLVYGHYDVQPVDPLELWDSAPFEPVVRDGRILARGAADDKGQIHMHLRAPEALLATKAESGSRASTAASSSSRRPSGRRSPRCRSTRTPTATASGCRRSSARPVIRRSNGAASAPRST